ncbi:MAG TPA: cytochrome c-type biogenesis protein [Steroidobacteraceae bacterium]|nr:cytochrome c-type biogenesis protein [Steroidobacteraceae bacterium]
MNRPAARDSVHSAALALLLAGALGAFPCLGVAAPEAAAGAQAVDANGQLEDHALQSRFERITLELRCLVCQNESIADSNADLAVDLRRQVREMLVAGQSDDAIFAFMTDRYGEFVRFRPPLEPKTLLIWGAPFIMLLLGGAIIFRVVRHRARMPVDDEAASGPDILK